MKLAMLVALCAIAGSFLIGFRIGQIRSVQSLPSLDEQEKCSRQAEHKFKQLGFKLNGDGDDLADFTNHLSSGRCLILITSHPNTNTEFGDSRTLFDAFEGKTYAEYGHYWLKGKHEWEGKPWACYALDRQTSSKVTCQSSEEFEALVAPYMDDRPPTSR